ncbi:hypothetical protein ES703_113341 [subsurface metagenome]
MSEENQPGEHYIPIGGIFLLFLGIVFLLQSFGILSWAIWETLWRFWPMLIIMAGLGILLRRYNVWLISLLMAALLFACLGIAIWQYEMSPPAGQSTSKMTSERHANEASLSTITITFADINISRSVATRTS